MMVNLFSGINKKWKFFIGLLFLFITNLHAQDFSNRGTDFWTGYGPHEKISSGTSDIRFLIAMDKNYLNQQIIMEIGTGHSKASHFLQVRIITS
jgi:hypothetical protein